MRLILTLCCLVCLAFTGCLGPLYGVYSVTKESDSEEKKTTPVVTVDADARLLVSPGIIDYTLYDGDSNPCGVTVEYSLNGVDFYPATEGAGGDGIVGLTASPGGTAHTFSWDYATGPDTGVLLPETMNVTLRITAADSQGLTASGESIGHSLGNAPPVIEAGTVSLPAGNVTGVVTVQYGISDTHADTAEIEVEFARDGDAWPGTAATTDVTGADDNITTAVSPGLVSFFPWNSNAFADLRGEDVDARVRIRASDDGGVTWGLWEESGGLVTVRNSSIPWIEFESADVLQNGIVLLSYICYDDEDNNVSMAAEYKTINETDWHPATAADGTTSLYMTASAAGAGGVFAWDSLRDGVLSEEVTFRLTPSEAAKTGIGATRQLIINNAVSLGWDTLTAQLPLERFKYCVGELNGEIYIIGGTGSAEVRALNPATGAWSTKAPLPAVREEAACVSACGKLYVFGGSLSDTVFEYDPETGGWTTKAPMPGGVRSRLAVAASGHKIMVVGGWDGSILNRVEVYNVLDNTWVTRTGMGTTRQNPGAAALNGRIYVTGGLYGALRTNTVESMDIDSGGWSGQGSMNDQRELHSCVAVNGRLFAMSGWGLYNTTVEMYNPNTNAWTYVDDVPQPRDGAGAVVLNNRIYLVGGKNPFLGAAWQSIVRYAPKPLLDGWQPMAGMPESRGSHGCASLWGRLYAAGGYTSSNQATVRVYDPIAKSWSSGPSMSVTRNPCRLVTYKGKIYAFGSNNQPEEYNPHTNNWTMKAAGVRNYFHGVTAVDDRIVCMYQENAYMYFPETNTWSTGTAMPTPSDHREFYGVAAYDGKVYMMGGMEKGTIQVVNEAAWYAPLTDTWGVELTEMGQTRTSPAVVTFGAGRIMVIGGNIGFGGIEATNHVEQYDSVLDEWTTLPVLPTDRLEPAGAELDGDVYSIAGRNDAGTPLNTCNYYDVVANQPALAQIGTLSSGVSGCVMAVKDNKLYVSGGENAAQTELDTLTEAEYLLPVPVSGAFEYAPEMQAVTAMPTARRHAGSVVYNDYIFAVGGNTGTGPVDVIEYYDTAADTWNTSGLVLSASRGGCGVVRVDDLMYIIGGDENGITAGGKTTVVQVYDLTTHTWAASPADMPTSRSHFSCIFDPVSRRLFALGGRGSSDQLLDTVEYLNVDTGAWSTAPGAMPYKLAGAVGLIEGGYFRLFGGTAQVGAGTEYITNAILLYSPYSDSWKELDLVLPGPLTDMAGCMVTHTWNHRGVAHTDEFVLLSGGFDGTEYRDEVFRFYTR